jgi:hypothetical protein
MASNPPKAELSPPTATIAPAMAVIPQGHRSQRVLACVLCQQRKVKCDRKFPCSNCIKARIPTQCVQATLAPRTRRRRFAERELIEQIRKYEGLLKKHNIKFEPLQKSLPSPGGSSNADADYDMVDDDSDDEAKSEGVFEVKSVFCCLLIRSLMRIGAFGRQ